MGSLGGWEEKLLVASLHHLPGMQRYAVPPGHSRGQRLHSQDALAFWSIRKWVYVGAQAADLSAAGVFVSCPHPSLEVVQDGGGDTTSTSIAWLLWEPNSYGFSVLPCGT